MNDIMAAAQVIKNGGLVGMPTETVYGLAANALDSKAVLSIFSAKQRPAFDPLIVHVANLEQAETIANFTPRAKQLANYFWPGPLTLVVPRKSIIPDVVTSGLETVGIRCPDHSIALELIKLSGVPVAAPSANRFGCLSPTTAEHVAEQLGSEVAVILNGGPCRVGIESTVLLPDPIPTILRPGGVTRESIEQVLCERVIIAGKSEKAAALPQQAPGLLPSHYAPQKKLLIKSRADQWPSDASVGILSWDGKNIQTSNAACEVLSASGDLAEAATNLFAALRRLDASPAQYLIAEYVPNHGLGLGINDRLTRAAGLG